MKAWKGGRVPWERVCRRHTWFPVERVPVSGSVCVFTECVTAVGTLELSHGPFPHLGSLLPCGSETPPDLLCPLSSLHPPVTLPVAARLRCLPPLPVPRACCYTRLFIALLSSLCAPFYSSSLIPHSSLLWSFCKLICGQPAVTASWGW